MTKSMKKGDLYFLGKKNMHIDHNALHFDLCRESMKRALTDSNFSSKKKLARF
jgi:hypothetical protein